MAMDVSPISWKNKRKKSLYAEEADMGFIFRKVHKPEVKKKAPEPVTNGLISPLLVNGSHEPGPLLVNGYRGRSLEDESMTSQDSTEHNISLNDSLLGGEILEGELEVHKEVELKRFVAQLKKELLLVGGATSEEEVDKALNSIRLDLKESGLYFNYMEAEGPDELLPHPLTEQLKEHIATLKASTEMYQRELKEWDELLEQKRTELEQAKRSCESNKKINYSNLRSEDVSALKTYLTPDQLKLLDQPSTIDPMFVQQTSTQLQDIHSRLDREVNEARASCQEMTEWLKSSVPDGGDSLSDETPRTLFRSLKRGLA